MVKTTSAAGIALLKQFEGCKLKAYKALPTEAYYTIGYGHYGADVKPDMTITLAQSETLLKSDLKRFEAAINSCVKTDINQNMFDALASISYNIGEDNLKTSTLIKRINTRDFIGAAAEFAKWNKSGGVVISGLIKRRATEAELFMKGYCDKPTYQVSSTTATKAQVRWIQNKLGGLTEDGAWGEKTAAVIQSKRKSLGWPETTGYICTVNLIKALG